MQLFDWFVLALPIIVLVLAYRGVWYLKKNKPNPAINIAFNVTFGFLLLWAVITLWVVFTGDNWSRLFFMYWYVFVGPVSLGVFGLVWSVSTLVLYYRQNYNPDATVEIRFSVFVAAIITLFVLTAIVWNLSYKQYQIGLADNRHTNSTRLANMTKIALAEDNIDLLEKLARNESTPPLSLNQLRMHKEDRIRLALCHNHNATVTILHYMVNDQSTYVRRCVAGHTNSSVDLLKSLQFDENPGVRRSVAANNNASPTIIANLSKDNNRFVRAQIANRANNPLAILELLSKDSDALVKRMAEKRLGEYKTHVSD